MRKLLYILIGLVLILIAISLGSYRHVYEPRARTATSTTRSIERAARPVASSRVPQTAQRPSTSAPATTPGTGLSAWATFDTVVNVLNVVVGIVGIVLALMGMRMQRAAMALQGGARDRR